VGIIMVIALLTLPVAISSKIFNRVWKIMLGATFLGMLFTCTGLMISYEPNLPSGAVTIVVAGVVYLLTLLFSLFKKRKVS
ncbi:MAG: metal ABC transporter permease, partial [Candidatus Riflebacteria bacterium]|nr:metal ABC transporter permease [Candidatus Riflebacteria bacterium]